MLDRDVSAQYVQGAVCPGVQAVKLELAAINEVPALRAVAYEPGLSRVQRVPSSESSWHGRLINRKRHPSTPFPGNACPCNLVVAVSEAAPPAVMRAAHRLAPGPGDPQQLQNGRCGWRWRGSGSPRNMAEGVFKRSRRNLGQCWAAEGETC